jgi:formylglycine-generating enzyme required for sulfatase activity
MFDLHGNLYEWTHDLKGDFGESRQIDPLGSKIGSGRVLRGGSWGGDAAGCRSAGRGIGSSTSRGTIGGFRVALSPSGIPQSPEADK